MKDLTINHIPVLLKEVIQSLKITSNGIYIDCTFGCGGHTKEILKHLTKENKLYAIDKDPSSIKIAKKIKDRRFHIISGNFSHILKNFGKQYTQEKVHGILLDLGISSMQINDSRRGFSFLSDGPLDMRMNPTIGITAAQWLMKSNLKSLSKVLYNFGEERFSKKIAKTIIKQNQIIPITRTIQLTTLIKKIVPKRRKHPATKTFQAIRIHINKELDELNKVLKYALKILAPNGRLLVISFHSLEDRIVKKFMLKNSTLPFIPSGIAITETQLKNLKKLELKIIKKFFPTQSEIHSNPRARSAILRVAEKKGIHE